MTGAPGKGGCRTVTILGALAVIALVAAPLLPDLHAWSRRHALVICAPILLLLVAAEAVRHFRSRS